MTDNYVLQFSIDISDDGDTDADKIVEILEQHGIAVLGCMWKASWTEEGYNKGEQPIYFD